MKKLFLLLALCAFTLTACDPNTEVEQKGKITLTSASVMNFETSGGTGEISFTFVEEQTRAKSVTAICVVDWISDIKIGSNKITFNVAQNNGKEREATIKVEHGTNSFSVMIMQDGADIPDVTFTATHLNGTYWGKFPTTVGFNYLVILGDKPSPHYLEIGNGATEYRFNIYSDVSSAFNKTHRIPVGRYTIDHSSSGRPGTIDGDKDQSYYLTNSSDIKFTDAVMVVTEDSIIVDVTLYGGEKHHVEYHGSLAYEGYTKGTYADVYPVSQYTNDITFNVTGGYIDAYFRGDHYGTGCNVWFMQLIEEKQPHYDGVYIILDLIVPKSDGGVNDLDIIEGEYPIFTEKPDNYEYTIPTGRLRDDCLQMHAWYLNCVSGQLDMSTAAPFTSGSVKVEKSDNGGYRFEINSTDDNGNKVIGTFSGVISSWEDQSCE